MPTTTEVETPVDAMTEMRERFATSGCGAREEFDAIVEIVRAVLAESKPKAAAKVVRHARRAVPGAKRRK